MNVGPLLESPSPILLSNHFQISFSIASNLVCRSAVDLYADLNSARCRRRGNPNVLVQTVYSNHARKCADQSRCHGESLCFVKKSYRGCTREFLQDGIDEAGFLGFFCYSDHPHLVLNYSNNPSKSSARCLNDSQMRARQATELGRQLKSLQGSLQTMLDEDSESSSDTTVRASLSETSP